MKVISRGDELSRHLKRLIEKYPHIAIATAWASASTEVFKTLVKHRTRITQAVIGTHFHQTDPKVLDQFVGSAETRFMMRHDGVFHPKVYLFWSDVTWEVIVGSPNLTSGAMNRNAELSLLVTSDDGQPGLKQELLEVIGDYWRRAETITPQQADDYREEHRCKASELAQVAASPGPTGLARVMAMDWPSYLAEVGKCRPQYLDERLGMLKAIRDQFETHQHFNDISPEHRKGIAGLPNRAIEKFEWFGNMRGAGVFFGRINAGDPSFSVALDCIPRTGALEKTHFDGFIAGYRQAFPLGRDGLPTRDGLATATRLLAMKRPDVFVCVDGPNEDALSREIDTRPPGKPLCYDWYWEKVITPIMNSPWGQAGKPMSPDRRETEIWQARAALLDVIFY